MMDTAGKIAVTNYITQLKNDSAGLGTGTVSESSGNYTATAAAGSSTVSFSSSDSSTSGATLSASVTTDDSAGTASVDLTMTSSADESITSFTDSATVTVTLSGYYTGIVYNGTDLAQPTVTKITYKDSSSAEISTWDNTTGVSLNSGKTSSDVATTVITFTTDHFSEFVAYSEYYPVASVSDLEVALAGGADVRLTDDLSDVPMLTTKGYAMYIINGYVYFLNSNDTKTSSATGHYSNIDLLGDTVIDLNGKTMKFQVYIAGLSGTSLTFTDSSSSSSADRGAVAAGNLMSSYFGAEVYNNGSLEIENVNLSTSSTGNYTAFYSEGGSTITIDHVTMDAHNGTAFYPRGDTSTIVIKDSIVVAGVYAVATNSSTVNNYGVKITVKNSSLTTTGDDSTTVMINVGGGLTIEGSDISGTRQALIVRAGTATVSESILTASLSLSGKIDSYLTDTDVWKSGNEVPEYPVVVGDTSSSAYNANAELTLTDVSIINTNDAYNSGESARWIYMAQDGSSYTSSLTYSNVNLKSGADAGGTTLSDSSITALTGYTASPSTDESATTVILAKNSSE